MRKGSAIIIFTIRSSRVRAMGSDRNEGCMAAGKGDGFRRLEHVLVPGFISPTASTSPCL